MTISPDKLREALDHANDWSARSIVEHSLLIREAAQEYLKILEGNQT